LCFKGTTSQFIKESKIETLSRVPELLKLRSGKRSFFKKRIRKDLRMTTIERLDRIPARIASRIKRVGTIPFVVDSDGNSFFAFGVDVTFGELTDFGGHRARNEELADVARRETIEESCKLFTFTNSQLNSSLSVYDSETCIIFVNLTSKRGDPKYGFPYNLQNKFDPNICRTQISDQKIETLTSYWIPASIISHIINLGRTLKFNGRGGKEFHLSKKTLFRDLEKYGNFDSLEWSKVHYSADFSELNLEGIASDKRDRQRGGHRDA